MEREKPLKSSKMQLVCCYHSTVEGTVSWLRWCRHFGQLPSSLATERTRLCAYSGPRSGVCLCWYLKIPSLPWSMTCNIGLSILFGQVWTSLKTGKCLLSSEAERAVFRAWIREGHQGVYRFLPQLYLWESGAGESGSHPNQKQACISWLKVKINCKTSLLLLFWDNGAVVTSLNNSISTTNSLQYKIDKWEELTGLQLKNLTGLALCYHLVLQMWFKQINLEFLCNLHKTLFLCETCHRFVKTFSFTIEL